MILCARFLSKLLGQTFWGEGHRQQVPGDADVWPRLGTTSLSISSVLALGDGCYLGSLRMLR